MDKTLVHEQLLSRVGEMQDDNTVAIPIDGRISISPISKLTLTSAHNHIYTLISTHTVAIPIDSRPYHIHTLTLEPSYHTLTSAHPLIFTHYYHTHINTPSYHTAGSLIIIEAFMKMCEEEVERLELRRRARDKFKVTPHHLHHDYSLSFLYTL